jgi:hypothetical protein
MASVAGLNVEMPSAICLLREAISGCRLRFEDSVQEIRKGVTQRRGGLGKFEIWNKKFGMDPVKGRREEPRICTD